MSVVLQNSIVFLVPANMKCNNKSSWLRHKKNDLNVKKKNDLNVIYCKTRKCSVHIMVKVNLFFGLSNTLPAKHLRAHHRVYPSPAGLRFGPSEFSIQ